jgi:hypothetical protein
MGNVTVNDSVWEPGLANSVLQLKGFGALASSPPLLEIHLGDTSRSHEEPLPFTPKQREWPLSGGPFAPLRAQFMTPEALFLLLGGAAVEGGRRDSKCADSQQ